MFRSQFKYLKKQRIRKPCHSFGLRAQLFVIKQIIYRIKVDKNDKASSDLYKSTRRNGFQGELTLICSANRLTPLKMIKNINYQLSIERSALEFTAIIFFHSAPTLSLENKKSFAYASFNLPLSQVADCETTPAVNRLTIKRYVGACKK